MFPGTAFFYIGVAPIGAIPGSVVPVLVNETCIRECPPAPRASPGPPQVEIASVGRETGPGAAAAGPGSLVRGSVAGIYGLHQEFGQGLELVQFRFLGYSRLKPSQHIPLRRSKTMMADHKRSHKKSIIILKTTLTSRIDN